MLESSLESVTLFSDGSETWKNSEITYNDLYIGEIINPLAVENIERAISIYETPESKLRKAIGTPDRVIREIKPKKLRKAAELPVSYLLVFWGFDRQKIR